jgi:short subunit dehydrogenase-like uncharacterized protein
MRAKLNPVVSGRKYDVVVWGATGFTGSLVAEYLAANYNQGGESVRWAIGGRNAAKLQAVVTALGGTATPDVLLADSSDAESLRTMARQATVVITTVGPYAAYGAALVEACVCTGTHYVDLTGEPPFVRAMADAHHEAAVASGAKIVHCCGFDSIPSDLGTLLLVDHFRRLPDAPGTRTASVDFYMGAAKGGASGGTLASAIGIFSLGLGELSKVADPYYLNPRGAAGAAEGKVGPMPSAGVADRKGLWYDRRVGAFTMPFVMAIINTRVVRRSAALAGLAGGAGAGYGAQFRYQECMTCPPGPLGILMGLLLPVCQPLFLLLCLFTPGRAVLRWVLKAVGLAPGQGPSRHAQRTGFFKCKLLGVSETAPGKPARTATARVEGKEDPGYSGTAKMLTESALALALHGDELGYKGGGVLTPAVAIGMPLVERLRRKGFVFRVEPDAVPATGKPKGQ